MVKLKKKSLSRRSFRTHGWVIGNKNFFFWPSCIFRVIIFSCHNSRKATNKTQYFDTLSDLQFSPYVPIQLIPVGVERSNGTPTLTSHLRSDQSSNRGIGMWQVSGHPSKVDGFPRFLQFSLNLNSLLVKSQNDITHKGGILILRGCDFGK